MLRDREGQNWTSVTKDARSTLGDCEEELPEKPVGRLSVNCQPTYHQQITDRLPTGYRQLTDRKFVIKTRSKHDTETTVGRLWVDCWPTLLIKTVGQLLAVCRPTVGRTSVNCWPFVGQLSADCWSTVGQLSADKRPTVCDFPRILNYNFQRQN